MTVPTGRRRSIWEADGELSGAMPQSTPSTSWKTSQPAATDFQRTHFRRYGGQVTEEDAVDRMHAESIVSRQGVTIEQALEGLTLQTRKNEIIDGIEEVLGDASGDVWFDWSAGHCRLKIGVTTRVDSAKTEAVRRIAENAGLLGSVDIVNVVWSTLELEAAQERAREMLRALGPEKPWSAGRDPSSNSLVIDVPDDLTSEELKFVEAAVRAAGVSVRVETGASWAVPATAMPSASP